MVFSELRFFVFLAFVLAVYWLLRWKEVRKLWLLVASYCFYSVWDWRFTLLLLICTLLNFSFALVIYECEHQHLRRRFVFLSVFVNLGILGFFKYYNFFADSLVNAAHQFGFQVSSPTLDIVLPIGISFYTFQSMSYVIDVYRGVLAPTKSLTDYALFISFFPHCVAGPIVRAIDFLPQLDRPKLWSDINARRFLVLFIVGFFKKACISDNLSPYVDVCFAHPTAYSGGSLRLAVLLYAVQIYCDFSGYSDMALASAGLFGYRLCQNFDAPYLAVGITQFWRRWHMSLSSWLRDYLYIPLGGNRLGDFRTSVNLMVTMLLGGLWHGASWNFVIWGGLHGIALVFSQRVGQVVSLKPSTAIGNVVIWAATFWWVCFAWILFRAADLETVRTISMAWIGSGSAGLDDLPAILWIYVLLLAGAHLLWHNFEPLEHLQYVYLPVFSAALGILFCCALSVANNSSRPFIYFQF